MRIFDFLKIMNPSIDPAETKVHLATKGSIEHPLDVYKVLLTDCSTIARLAVLPCTFFLFLAPLHLCTFALKFPP